MATKETWLPEAGVPAPTGIAPRLRVERALEAETDAEAERIIKNEEAVVQATIRQMRAPTLYEENATPGYLPISEIVTYAGGRSREQVRRLVLNGTIRSIRVGSGTAAPHLVDLFHALDYFKHHSYKRSGPRKDRQ